MVIPIVDVEVGPIRNKKKCHSSKKKEKIMSLYEQIGDELIREAISRFYDRAFSDLFIGFIFSKFDKSHLIEMQILFATAMLGGPKNYRGKALKTAHMKFH